MRILACAYRLLRPFGPKLSISSLMMLISYKIYYSLSFFYSWFFSYIKKKKEGKKRSLRERKAKKLIWGIFFTFRSLCPRCLAMRRDPMGRFVGSFFIFIYKNKKSTNRSTAQNKIIFFWVLFLSIYRKKKQRSAVGSGTAFH